jgi:hypothetical protein
MRTRYSRLQHGFVFGAIALLFCVLVLAVQLTNAVNAHYFPEDVERIHWWLAWVLAAVATLCVFEAMFGVVLSRIRRLSNEAA